MSMYDPLVLVEHIAQITGVDRITVRDALYKSPTVRFARVPRGMRGGQVRYKERAYVSSIADLTEFVIDYLKLEDAIKRLGDGEQ